MFEKNLTSQIEIWGSQKLRKHCLHGYGPASPYS